MNSKNTCSLHSTVLLNGACEACETASGLLGGETCAVCELDFPSSPPNPAVADRKVPGLGWAYVCAAHANRGAR